MKFLLKLGLALVVVAFLVLLGVGFVVDGAAKAAIEEGGAFALGVPTHVDDAHVGLLTQTFSLDALKVENPKGYGGSSFLELDRGTVEVKASSLMSDEVRIPKVELDGVRATLVQGPEGANYDVILKSLQRFQGDDDAEDAPGKRYVIDELVVKRIEVRFEPIAGLDLVGVNVPVGDIVLHDIGSGKEDGVLLADVIGLVVEAILKGAADTGKLPPAVQGPLSGDLRSLSGLADAGIQAIDDVLRGNKDAMVEQGRDSLKKGIEGLLGK